MREREIEIRSSVTERRKDLLLEEANERMNAVWQVSLKQKLSKAAFHTDNNLQRQNSRKSFLFHESC